MLGKCQMRKYKVSCGWGTIQNQRRVFARRIRLKTRITLMAPTLGRKGPLKFGHQPYYYHPDRGESQELWIEYDVRSIRRLVWDETYSVQSYFGQRVCTEVQPIRRYSG